VVIPEEAERQRVHDVIYDELVKGVVRGDSRADYTRIARGLVEQGARGIIAGCTEIEQLLRPGDVPVPLFPSAELHALAAATDALSGVGLRRAGPADLDFVRRVQRAAMEPAVAAQLGPWDEALQHQATNLRTIGSYEVGEVAGEAVAAVQIVDHEDAVQLSRLYVMPQEQGQGIGTQLVGRAQGRARRRGVPLRLQTLTGNEGARLLYERLGFVAVATSGAYVQMCWSPED